MKTRKTYDTKVKYLVKQGLLPERYKQNIHCSLLCKWKQEPVEKYIGYELNVGMDELYEVLKTVTENEKLQKVIRAYYRINKTLRDVIGKGNDYVSKIRGKKEIISAIQHTAKAITKKRSLKLLGISQSTYRTWAMETYYKCTNSLKKICSSNYPQQLTIREIKKMHGMLMNKKYLHWPIMSVAYYRAVDYNCRRPHGALSGLTPEESYFGMKLNLKKAKAKIRKVMDERILWNQSHSCKGCPFGCAHG